MSHPLGLGWFLRTCAAAGRALKRGFLGKSGHEYMKHFTGSDVYWDEAVAAQRVWPRKIPKKK